MDAKELKIGNYVKDHLGRVQKVSETRSNAYICYLSNGHKLKYKLNTTNTIPLTEEWLFKFGFYYGESIDYGYLWLKCKMGEFYVRPSYLGGFYWGFDYDNEINGQNNIKHVHQLQNLYFALTNEELKLK